MRYNLNSPEHRRVIKEFEQDIKGVPNKPCAIMVALGAGRRMADGRVAATNPVRWTDIREKEKALDVLRAKREYAREQEKKSAKQMPEMKK